MDRTMKKPKKHECIQCVENIMAVIIIMVVFFVYTRLFYCQAEKYNDMYESDLPSHIIFAISDKGYSMLYSVMDVVYNIGGNIGIAVLESLIVVGTWILSAKLFSVLIEKNLRVYSMIVTFPLLILTGIYLPSLHEFFYKQQIVSQPYHNITYYGMRFLSVAVMYVLCKEFKSVEKGFNVKSWLIFSTLLAAGTSIKPNFFLGFAFTLFLFLVYEFIVSKSKKEELKRIIIIGTTVVPSMFLILYQAVILYGGDAGSSSGIGFNLGANFIVYGIKTTVFKILCGLTLPTIVFIHNRKKFKDVHSFVYIMYLVQLTVVIIFTETGMRANHGNFYWGLYNAAYLLFLICISQIWINFKEKKHYVYKIVVSVLLLGHIISGFLYFVHVFMGKNFFV